MTFLPNKDHPLFKDGYDAGLADGLRLAKSDAAILADRAARAPQAGWATALPCWRKVFAHLKPRKGAK